MLRLIGTRCSKASILCPSLLKHGTVRSFYIPRPDPDDMSDYSAFLDFLMLASDRMSQHFRCHIFWAAGSDSSLSDWFMSDMLEGTSYPSVFHGMEDPREPGPFDDCGEILIPDPRFIDYCQGLRNGGSYNYVPYNARQMMYQFVCRAEKDMFAGEPNVRELQREMRLFAGDLAFRGSSRLVDDLCCYELKAGPMSTCYDYDLIQACEHKYSADKHAKYLYWLKRAQMVADNGGLQTDSGTGFTALFNYQLKHAYKIHHKYTYYHVISERDRLVWSSFQNQKYYTIDVQGLTSTESVEVDYIPALQVLVFSAPGLKCTEFSLPAHADGEETELLLRDGVLTLRVPLHQPFTLDFNECRRDGHSFEVETPQGVSPEDAVVRVIPSKPSLILSLKSDNSRQACFTLPANIHAKGITAFLEDDVLTVFTPKVEESDYMAVSLSSRLQVLRDLLVPPVDSSMKH